MLSPAAYRVLRQAGTELPLSSPLYREKRPGTYKCGFCSCLPTNGQILRRKFA